MKWIMVLVIVFSVYGGDTIRWYFVGDCTIGSEVDSRYFDRYVEDLGVRYFMGGVREVLRSGDFSVGNLETTIGELGSPREKRFRFRGRAGYLDILKDGGIGIVSIANNHIYDYGDIGYGETCENLDSAWNGVPVIGSKDVTWMPTIFRASPNSTKDIKEKMGLILEASGIYKLNKLALLWYNSRAEDEWDRLVL